MSSTAKENLIALVILLLIGGFVGSYYFGHHLGFAKGYSIGYSAGGSYANADAATISSLNTANTNLQNQYNNLSSNYNTLRDAIIKYVGSTTYQPAPQLHCTSVKYGINNQFTSTNCY